ncbi:MAG: hypothetical protein PHE50_00115 [Dehalococcoidales bacterium]|nr:hypothetical protein [Dehalococcoidales bacterium]
MNFKIMRRYHYEDVREVFGMMLLDKKLWDAIDECDLTEIGRIVYKNLDTRKKEIEEDEGFDPDEAARDVIRESQAADIQQHNRKLS